MLFSMDHDLLAEATSRLASGSTISTVTFARPHEITIGRCVQDLELLANLAAPEERLDQIVHLPL